MGRLPRRLFITFAAAVLLVALPAGLLHVYGIGLYRITEVVGLTDTEFAPGYSEKVFRGIDVGTSEEDVLAMLGEPLRTYSWAEEDGFVWVYCEAASGGRYWERSLRFEPEQGRVVAIDMHLRWS